LLAGGQGTRLGSDPNRPKGVFGKNFVDVLMF